jgi:hypothetical protein
MKIFEKEDSLFQICNLNFAFCPAEARRLSSFYKGLNYYKNNYYSVSPLSIALSFFERNEGIYLPLSFPPQTLRRSYLPKTAFHEGMSHPSQRPV